MSSDKDLREDVEEMRNALKEATERLRALEHKVAVARDRIIYIGACEQKLRDIRDDLDVVRAKLSVLPNASADVAFELKGDGWSGRLSQHFVTISARAERR
jgi:hypothetical protein